MNHHQFQLEIVKDRVGLGPILNAASKEDPANLSQYGVTNFDISTHCEMLRQDLRLLPNFVLGSVLEMSKHFKEGKFKTVILGEYLEHCVFSAAVTSLVESRKVLADDGMLTLTFPLDGRPPEVQHAKEFLKIWVEGDTGHDITVAHQTVWEDAMLETLFSETGWSEISRTELSYGFVKDRTPNGWGILLEKA